MALKRVTLGDESWDFDEESLTIGDLFAIKAASGLNGKQFQEGLNDIDPASYQVLVWWLRGKNGTHQPISSVDFRVSDLRVEAVPVAESDDDEENPTVTGSEPVATVTSDSSPTTAT